MSDTGDEILRRAEIAAELFCWSPAHKAGFVDGVREALSDPATLTSPNSWHLTFDTGPYCFSQREAVLTDAELERLGRYEAYRACCSWLADDGEEWTPEAVAEQVRFWWDEDACDFAIEEADMDYVEDFDVSRLLEINGLDGWREWLAAEHAAHLEDGREGYADMVVERHYMPKFYVDNGEGAVLGIFDGWHRSAGDVIAGNAESRVVMTSRRPCMAMSTSPRA